MRDHNILRNKYKEQNSDGKGEHVAINDRMNKYREYFPNNKEPQVSHRFRELETVSELMMYSIIMITIMTLLVRRPQASEEKRERNKSSKVQWEQGWPDNLYDLPFQVALAESGLQIVKTR